MMTHDREEYVLVVSTSSHLLAKVDVAVLWTLCADVLRPTKEQKFAHLVQNTVCFLEFPCVQLSTLYRKIDLQKFKEGNRHALQFLQSFGSHIEFSGLHVPF